MQYTYCPIYHEVNAIRQYWSCNKRKHEKHFIFGKPHTKRVGETIPRPFPSIKINHISGSIVQSFIVCFYCMPSWGLSKYIKTILLYKAFLKTQGALELTSLAHILHYFWRSTFVGGVEWNASGGNYQNFLKWEGDFRSFSYNN